MMPSESVQITAAPCANPTSLGTSALTVTAAINVSFGLHSSCTSDTLRDVFRCDSALTSMSVDRQEPTLKRRMIASA